MRAHERPTVPPRYGPRSRRRPCYSSPSRRHVRGHCVGSSPSRLLSTFLWQADEAELYLRCTFPVPSLYLPCTFLWQADEAELYLRCLTLARAEPEALGLEMQQQARRGVAAIR